MELEKALALRELINDASKTYNALISEKTRESVNLEEAKARFTSEQFALHYNAFMKELDKNILEYENYRIIKDYFNGIFNDFRKLDNNTLDCISKILKVNFEVEFLSGLKSLYIKYYELVAEFSDNYYDFYPNSPLYKYFFEQIKTSTGKEMKPIYYGDFEINELKTNYYTPKYIKEQIKKVFEAIYDFKQWQLEYDIKIETENGVKYKYTEELYPNYEDLCNIELDRLYKRLEILDLIEPPKPTTNKENDKENDQTDLSDPGKPALRWSKSDTDLIELITALFHSESIKRKDNKNLTRKELLEFFEEILDIEVKHSESKLSRTSDRKKSLTPYLDKLKNTFENYVEEKDDKQRERK